MKTMKTLVLLGCQIGNLYIVIFTAVGSAFHYYCVIYHFYCVIYLLILRDSSSLASIFQDASSGAHETSKSLVYTAPKQPVNKKQGTLLTKGVLAASAVTCYKL